MLHFSSSVSKKKSSYCDRCRRCPCRRYCHRRCRRRRRAKTLIQPITQKVLKISTPNWEYLLIMTKCSCKTRCITLKAIILELCPFLTFFN